jgi:hypothetical protein
MTEFIAFLVIVALLALGGYFSGYRQGSTKYNNFVQAVNDQNKKWPNKWEAYRQGVREGYEQGLRDGQNGVNNESA